MNRILAFFASTVLLYAAAVELCFLFLLVLALATGSDIRVAEQTVQITSYFQVTLATLVGVGCGGLAAGFLTPAFDGTRWYASAWAISALAITVGLLNPSGGGVLAGDLELGGVTGGVAIALGALGRWILSSMRSRTRSSGALLPERIRTSATVVFAFWCLLWGSLYLHNHDRAESEAYEIAHPLPNSGIFANPSSYQKMVDQLRPKWLVLARQLAHDSGLIGLTGGAIGALALAVVFTRRRATPSTP